MTRVNIPNTDLEETTQIVRSLCESSDDGSIEVKNGSMMNTIRLQYRPKVEYDSESGKIAVKRRTGIGMATITPESELTAVGIEDAERILREK